MPVQAQSADGVVHEFPDGTDPSVVDKAMKAYVGDAAAQPSPAAPPRPASAVPTADNQPPQPFSDTQSEPQNPPLLSRIGSAVGSAFKEPLGLSEENIAPFTSGPISALNSVNRALLGGGSAALDALGRPILAGVRGLAALGGGVAEKLGADPTASRKIEKDLNVMGEGAMVEAGKTPGQRPPSVGAGEVGTKALDAGGRFARWLGGVEPEEGATASRLMKEGYTVSPAFAHQLPSLQRKVEYARIFGWDPTGASATKLVRDRATQFLVKMGKTEEEAKAMVERVAGPATPTMERTGSALQTEAEKAQADIDAKFTKQREDLDREITAAKEGGDRAGLIKTNLRESAIARLSRDKATSLAHADEMISDGWRALDSIKKSETIDQLSADFPQRLEEMRHGTSHMMGMEYDKIDAAMEGATKDISAVKDDIANFERDMPDSVKENEKPLIRTLKEMAETGTATYGQLHWLRNELRSAGFNPSLSPNFKTGPYRLMTGIVDRLLHEAEEDPRWQKGATMLDATDKVYGENIAIYRNKIAQHMVDETRDGKPPDPAAVSRALNDDLQRDRRRELLSLVGEPLKERVWASTLQDLFESSRQLGSELNPLAPNALDARKVLENVSQLYKNGALEDYRGKAEADEIMRWSQRLAQRRGAIEVDPVRDGGFARSLQKAAEADVELQKLAKIDPASLLLTETEKATKRAEELAKRAKSITKGENPLGAFLEPSRGVSAAAEELLNPNRTDRLRAVVGHLPPDHPAIRMLREEAFEKMIQPFFEGGGDSKKINPEQAIGPYKGLSSEAQDILFPDIDPGAIPKLAAEVRTIIGKPTGTLPGLSAGAILSLPPPIRVPIIMYHQAMAWIVTRPALLNMLAGDLSAGGAAAAKAKAAITRIVDTATEAELRAGAAVAANEQQRQPQAEPSPHAAPDEPWHARIGKAPVTPEWAKTRFQPLRPLAQPPTVNAP